MSLDGAALFARFAFPPNALGYCGPPEADTLLAGATQAEAAVEVARLAPGFEGAWPYLELLADTARTGDPLDRRVVEAYWIGNDLLTQVHTNPWGWHLVDRFRPRIGPTVDRLTALVGNGAVPNHAFHVLGVYPWVGLLRDGVGGEEPLRIVDRCRIRWARVDHLDGPDRAVVTARPLVWERGRLALGAPVAETVRVVRYGVGLGGPVTPGALVACHWDWICHELSPTQFAHLRNVTHAQLRLANQTDGAAARLDQC